MLLRSTPWTIAICLGLAAGSLDVEGELLDSKVRKSLRTAGEPLAKLGDPELMASFEALLQDAGDAPEDFERFKKRWDKTLEKASGAEPSARDRAGAAKKIQRVLGPIEKELRLDGVEEELAQWTLRLDAENEAAHLELGHVQVDGRWLGERGVAISKEMGRFRELFQKARDLDVEVAWDTAGDDPTALAAFGEGYGTASSNGIIVHGAPDAHHLESVIREVHQAMAYASAVLGGKLEVQTFDPPIRIIFAGTEEGLHRALVDVERAKTVDVDLIAMMRERRTRGVADKRGFYLAGWIPDPSVKSMIAWQAMEHTHGRLAQPAFFAGHLNSVCLQFFGASMPTVQWKELGADGQQGSTAKPTARESAMWRAASSGMFGARSWLKRQLENGKSPTFARAIQDKMGKIEAEPLLVATVVSEYLCATGELGGLLRDTQVETDRLATIEKASARTIPELDAEWHGWIMGLTATPGILQRAAPNAEAETKLEPTVLAGFEHLKKRRAEAHGGLGVWIEELELFEELSEGAVRHAEYLHRNPDQQTSWPEAHEEYPDRAGFTSEGAWAGQHSVIHFTPSFEEAIDSWLGTFYHRLPLLDPGLFGSGLGTAHGITLLDTASLRNRYGGDTQVLWPADGAKDVPTEFVPELPNPVPGEDQSKFGYAITLQEYIPFAENQRTYAMELRVEGSDKVVDCYFLSPSHYYFDKHVPDNAFALLPKAHLSPRTQYVVSATCHESGEVLRRTFRTGK